ncbi:ATP-grasp domain-containing protein [Alicyclobacillus cycloheptanicus]|uniref:ATP-grasp superfamily ATP-dependent carboligase n=1 Tax=Alicyclobacillus cycloheptanicus TaxID=1457 RepID=A0ABT9XIH6_9BACL|nr:ATP-grasp domain-containing protein [Alicyclobacillus cycloheptanicus]MDQ0190119.1 putative ATP-grasp superfamily ATP-dependent carboligase [Alicyclobacillus cycloheptanicus]WDM02091.1 ATP-grasp domain-containing protein [Alicyclobacillus cycloheptanicus]
MGKTRQVHSDNRVPSALLTNGMLRKTLAAARSLGRRGVGVAVAEASRLNPSAWSKFCRRRLVYPNPAADPAGFLAWLTSEASAQSPMVLFPMDDDVMDALMQPNAPLPAAILRVLPPPDVYWQMRDKLSATAAARDFGFCCPATCGTAEETVLRNTIAAWPAPWVVKARCQSGSRGLSVTDSLEDVVDQWRAGMRDGRPPLVQQYVPLGERIDVCLLLTNDSRCVAGFVQRELRHFPIRHGPSSAQESIADEPLLAMCREFAESIGWRGVIEFEFMRNGTTGQLTFMEANTRFWNSLHCSILAGVDFPWMYYQLALDREVAPCFQYQTGVICRSLLPADMLHFLANPRRFSSHPPFFGGRRAGGEDDILSWSDVGPTFGYLWALCGLSVRKETWRDLFRRR